MRNRINVYLNAVSLGEPVEFSVHVRHFPRRRGARHHIAGDGLVRKELARDLRPLLSTFGEEGYRPSEGRVLRRQPELGYE